jgi:cytoskeletal protein CcmA (bactofilin family)
VVTPSSTDTLTIDPVAMNIVNRVAQGSELSGELSFEGGLLVQGTVAGHVRVKGRLVIWTGAEVRGRIRVQGDVYLFGQLGAENGGPADTHLECQGMVYVSKTGVSTGTLLARRVQVYEGGQLKGPLRTLVAADTLPVLRDIVVVAPGGQAPPSADQA